MKQPVFFKHINLYKIMTFVVILILALTGFRLLWTSLFTNQEEAAIHDGELHLNNEDFDTQHFYLLDGAWDFYPDQLLENNFSQTEQSKASVPGSWGENLNPDTSSPYGYGTYRLQIHVDPEEKHHYSVRIPSIRSASAVYVNGEKINQSGEVGTSKDDYTAKNVPYTANFTADDNGNIDLTIQVANFKDPRSSGIARSILFGTEEKIANFTNLSTSTQVILTIILFMHSIYGFIIYWIGDKNKHIFYFSLATLSLMISNMFSTGEKIANQLFYIGYEWDFRIANIFLLLLFYALLKYVDSDRLRFWKKIQPYYAVAVFATMISILFLTTSQIFILPPWIAMLTVTALLVSFISLFQSLKQHFFQYYLIVFAFIAIIHHFVWRFIWEYNHITTAYYPFDMIFALVCIVVLWFQDYYRVYDNTRRLSEKLQYENEQKDQFLATTSHEFKNPLHSMINLSESTLTRENHVLDDRSKNELRTVLNVGKRMSLILNDLLDVQGTRNGYFSMHFKSIDLHSVVNIVMDMLRPEAKAKQLKLVNGVPPDFAPVKADENRLIQIIFNVIHNAVKFTHHGSIHIHSHRVRDNVYVSIEDTGIGIEHDKLDDIFQSYEKENAHASGTDNGFGLGLTVTKQLVEQHGGEVTVTSVPNEGSTFTFSLQKALDAPVNKATDEVAASNIKAMAPPVLEQHEKDAVTHERPVFHADDFIHDPRVLLVDDDPVNLQVMEAILPSFVDMTSVTSGKEALVFIHDEPWDVVISDIMMPRMSGYELTEKIRERFDSSELPVLLLTARSQPTDIHHGFLTGANDYVQKPVNSLELQSRVKSLILNKQQVKEQIRLEAAWLQAQIQPHFIFNALNAIVALSEIDLERMKKLVKEFSEFLKYKFEFQRMDSLISLSEEVHVTRSYTYIESIRYGERLHVEWDLNYETNVSIPFLSIQPLVENAIAHGVTKKLEGGKVVIRIHEYDTHMFISIEDNGKGMEARKLEHLFERKQSSGVGIINVDRRLEQFFGERLQIDSVLNEGTTVSFTIPKNNKEISGGEA